MAISRENRNSLIYVGFLLLAGLVHGFDNKRIFPSFPIRTLLFCLNYLIYTGLLLFWIRAVQRRLLPSAARSRVIAAALFMLLLLLLRTVKYRVVGSASVVRTCWYAFYIPIVMIPTLFLMTCICLDKPGSGRKTLERLLLIPAVLLVLGVLSNDLHHLAFAPKPGLASFIGDNGTFTHGPLYYGVYTWVGLCIAGGILYLLRTVHRLRKVRGAVLPLLFLLLWPVMDGLMYLSEQYTGNRIFQLPEITIFCLIGVFESCIRNHLIPSNENYPGFFGSMDSPILITDRQFAPVWNTAGALQLSREEMRAALAAPLYQNEDTRLFGRAISAGYAFWTEDVRTIHRLNAELESANDTLALENELLEREREQRAEIALVAERNALYAKAAMECYGAQKKIDALLALAEPGTPDFRAQIAKALALTAYVKRKSNFVMIEAERDAITAGELEAAINESAHYFAYCGLSITLDRHTERDWPCREAMAVYDSLEAIFELLCGKTPDCFVRLEESGFLCLAEYDQIPELPEMPVPVSARVEDGQLFLTGKIGGAP